MEFPAFVPPSKPLHLHFLESKPGIHDDISHLNPDGSGGWRPKLMHMLQSRQRARIEKSFRGFIENQNWSVSANSEFSAQNLHRIYGIKGGVLYPRSISASSAARSPGAKVRRSQRWGWENLAHTLSQSDGWLVSRESTRLSTIWLAVVLT